MAEQTGVEPDAEVIQVTDIFLEGGLRIQARGDCKKQIKAQAAKSNWLTVKDLNENDVELQADKVLTIIVSEGQLQRVPQKPPGTDGEGFAPKIVG